MLRPAAASLLVAAALVAPAALAKRAPTRAEASAIRRAVAAYVSRAGSPAAKDNRVVAIKASTVAAGYALARLESKAAGPSHALLHRTHGAWKVVDFGSGAFPCSDASAGVLKDLIGGCVP